MVASLALGLGLVLGSSVCAAQIPQPAPSAPAQIDVQPDPQGAQGLIHGHIDIDAPPETVWKVVVDCGQAGRLMVGIKSCRVLQSDPAGRWDLREQYTSASILPPLRTVLRSDYDEPHTARFHRMEGALRVLDGEWRLEPLDGGARTRLFYEGRMAAPFPAPGPVVRSMLRSDMPRTLENIRSASEAAVAAAPHAP
ncbi:MAG: SRPBCC family protein [Caulobacteraceae bacterium]|nr:SRPBCC family protein [Caulobacteraceae bacterium]